MWSGVGHAISLIYELISSTSQVYDSVTLAMEPGGALYSKGQLGCEVMPEKWYLSDAKTPLKDWDLTRALVVTENKSISTSWGKSVFRGDSPCFWNAGRSLVLSIQSRLTLCKPTDCSLARLLCLWDSLGKNTEVGYHALLQGTFLTQGSNLYLLCLLHCRQILYHWATRSLRVS